MILGAGFYSLQLLPFFLSVSSILLRNLFSNNIKL
jgi:hypothetical protein